MKPKLTFCCLVIACFAYQLNAQNACWNKVNLAPYMLSKSPFSGQADCYGMPKLEILPIQFRPFILVDSLYILNDLTSAKVTFRYIHSINQIDTNDLNYYEYISDSFSRASIINHNSNIRTKKFGDSLYFFKLHSNSSNDPFNQFDSVSLVSALKMHDMNCRNNFYFNPCLLQYQFNHNHTWSSKNGKQKPKPTPDCYKISDLKNIKNNAQAVTLTLPLKNYSVGIGNAYFELFDYLKTWNPNTKLMYKPIDGKMDVSNKIWLIRYDTSAKKTVASISLYNGGTDTMFISSCVNSSGHIKVNKFPQAIAPASWGSIEVMFDNTSLSYIPINSNFMINTKRETSKKNLLISLNYRIHR